MTPDEEHLRKQLAEAEETNRQLRQRLAEAENVMDPFLAMAMACEHMPDEAIVLRRPIQKMSGYQLVNIEVRHLKALLDWSREEQSK